MTWQGDINRASGTADRPLLRLLQLDIAIRDSRAKSTTGWVFGTFQYEKDASTSANWWEHLVPVGLMWGNDVPHLVANQPPVEQWINADRGQKLHLGFRNQLLDGPIDNPHASCSACHGLAQINRINNPPDPLPARPTSDALSPAAIQKYFRNLKAAEAFSANYFSLDYSLQLQVGIANALGAGQATLPAAMASHANIRGAARSPASEIRVIPMSRADD